MQIFYNNYGDIMKVLSIKEPYASLIMMNIKKIETRSFKLSIAENYIFMLV